MKSYTKIAAAAAVASMSNASLTACQANEWEISVKAFMQGMQQDSSSITTGCFAEIESMVDKFIETGASFYGPNFSWDDWLKPVYSVIDSANSLVDGFVYCDTTNFAKQFSNRFTTWSGFLELATTIGMSFVKNYAYTTDQSSGTGNVTISKLYTAGDTFFTSNSCVQTARALGEMFHYAVFFEIQEDNYADQLAADITA